MGKIILFLLTVILAACSKDDRLEMEYRQSCTGDQSIKCRAMMIDLSIAKAETGIEQLRNQKDVIANCVGEIKYKEGITLAENRIEYLHDLKPNIFFRIFLSGNQVEFDPPPFKQQRELRDFLISSNNCKSAHQSFISKDSEVGKEQEQAKPQHEDMTLAEALSAKQREDQQLAAQSIATPNPASSVVAAPESVLPKLSAAAEKAVGEGFVEIKNPVVRACTDKRIDSIRKEIGGDSAISYEMYNEAAVKCGFNI